MSNIDKTTKTTSTRHCNHCRYNFTEHKCPVCGRAPSHLLITTITTRTEKVKFFKYVNKRKAEKEIPK